MTERTQVGIIGAGPAGLLLSHLLARAGIESVVVERRSRQHVEGRVRAGVLEQGAAELLRASGVGERMDREGLVHSGINLQFAGKRHHIDFMALTGRTIVVYGQQEIVKDLISARLQTGGRIHFEAEAVRLEGIVGSRPSITYLGGGEESEIGCDFVAACDGAHGIGRAAVPATVYERAYPHGWLGILARTPPVERELIYACHENGFALHSMRSSEVSRLYLQVSSDEDLANWPEARIWEQLRLRLAEPELREGEILDLGITALHSLVLEPMQHGRLYLAGDSAHIVPPTGAKGMNLALADVQTLARALAAWYLSKSTSLLDAYSKTCLTRVWRAQQFSAFMTGLLHRTPTGDPFEHRLQLAQLAYLTHSLAASTSLAENYTSAATSLDGGT
ncbi:MAG: 4-hydroxybenzoate 3-monooxygenase [Candidatus Dormibacteraeota bacterium]|nr:4-hydroxybenzoate 3-monooxygenase [Candidatus Dormibacteraeota bacterium]